MTQTAAQVTAALPPPAHIAIIMDGNGRWAKARGLPRTAGHKTGAEAVRRTVEAARALGISYLTLYAFSSENWKRPEGEVTDLMGLLRLYLRNEVSTMNKNGVRLRVIGDRSRLSSDLNALIDESEAKTANNVNLTLVLALSYGGRQELVQAARALAQKAVSGEITPDCISEDIFASHLYTHDIPDPDLLIRTSGEQRISNFLLWQAAYAELVFSDVLWPDFNQAHLEDAIRAYAARERRFGGTGA